MKVLIACEYSGRVRESFREKGHEAVSCDILPSLVEGPHRQEDVLGILAEGWDLLVAFPPCTHLARSGARWFPLKEKEQNEAADFFMALINAPIPKIAIENPVGVMSTRYRKPDQIIHPWMFGDEARKQTCLWLKNLPLLKSTEIVSEGEIVVHGGKKIPAWYSNHKKRRDLTFLGIAKAMADQWG